MTETRGAAITSKSPRPRTHVSPPPPGIHLRLRLVLCIRFFVGICPPRFVSEMRCLGGSVSKAVLGWHFLLLVWSSFSTCLRGNMGPTTRQPARLPTDRTTQRSATHPASSHSALPSSPFNALQVPLWNIFVLTNRRLDSTDKKNCFRATQIK